MLICNSYGKDKNKFMLTTKNNWCYQTAKCYCQTNWKLSFFNFFMTTFWNWESVAMETVCTQKFLWWFPRETVVAIETMHQKQNLNYRVLEAP